MLRLTETCHHEMLAHALRGLPDEACGLLLGPSAPSDADAGEAEPTLCDRFEPCDNAAASSRVYSVAPRDFLRIDRAAEDAGREVIGVMHSHTHTEPYPSKTDVDQAPDPAWHYVIVSLRDLSPMLRSYRIVDGGISEEPVLVDHHAIPYH